MRKKIVSLFILFALMITSIVGCGNSEDGSNSGSGDITEIEVYGLTMVPIDEMQEVVDAINEISEKEIGVRIKYEVMDMGTYAGQMSLMFSSGEAGDLVLTTPIPVASFASMTAQNQLLDISDLLTEYAPELKETVGDIINGCKVGDAIYAVPTYRILNSENTLVMRTDILEELGLVEQAEAISSWSDYEAILKAVADGQSTLPENLRTTSLVANGDAGANVLTTERYMVDGDSFSDIYGFDSLGDTYKVVMVDESTDTVMNYYESDGYQEMIGMVNKWYNNGWVYRDAATSPDGGQTFIQNGVTFSYVSTGEMGSNAVREAAISMDLTEIKLADIPLQTGNAQKFSWGVPSTSEAPEAAVKFMNLMYTNADIENLLCYGIEGRDYELNDKGEAVKLDGALYSGSDFLYGNQFLAYPAKGQGSDFRETTLAAFKDAPLSKYYGCSIDTSGISNEITAVNSVLEQYNRGLQAGSLSLSQYDTFIKAMKDANVQKIIDEYQKQLDEWLAEQ